MRERRRREVAKAEGVKGRRGREEERLREKEVKERE